MEIKNELNKYKDGKNANKLIKACEKIKMPNIIVTFCENDDNNIIYFFNLKGEIPILEKKIFEIGMKENFSTDKEILTKEDLKYLIKYIIFNINYARSALGTNRND